MLHTIVLFVICTLLPASGVCQIVHTGLSENFDLVIPPELPPQWSGTGWSISSTAARSSPNAVAAVGNSGIRVLQSPVVDLGGGQPFELTFYERRSSTAALYGLEVAISADGFQSLIHREVFESIPQVSVYVKRTLDLSMLDGGASSRVQMRWRILPDSTNSTGVLRIDDVELSTRSSVDLALVRVFPASEPVTTLDEIIVGAEVRNVGLLSVSDYGVEFSLGGAMEGSTTVLERFAMCPGPPLEPGDSVIVQAVHPPQIQGTYRVVATIHSLEDGDGANDTASVGLRIGVPARSVLINEIMYAPSTDEPEWIELRNMTADSLRLQGWKISDHTLAGKDITGSPESVLGPGAYAIVARDESFLAVHPLVDVPFFTADFSAMNNASADGPILTSDQGLTIDSVRYDPAWGGQGGRSLERIDTDQPSTDASTWTTSVDSSGSTPGRENSTARLEYDLAVILVQAVESPKGLSYHLTISVLNAGKKAIPNHTIFVFADEDRNGQGEEGELLAVSEALEPLLPGDFRSHILPYFPASPGEHDIIARVQSGLDQRSRNDEGGTVVWARHSKGAMIINELMYDPLAESCEWVELHNPTAVECDLSGWSVSDTGTASGAVNRFPIADASQRVSPGGFFVIAADSTIFSSPFFLTGDGVAVVGRSTGLGFSNDGDAVVVRDASGATIDSLTYDPGMHHPHVLDIRGRSLERIRAEGWTNDRLNWSTASGLRGGSPGEPNTIAAAVLPTESLISVQPNPFSPDGDGKEEFCVIVLALPFPTASVRVRIFDTRGRLVRTVAASRNVGAHSQIIWNGLDDDQSRLPVGPYIVLVEATDPHSGQQIVRKVVVVVAKRL